VVSRPILSRRTDLHVSDASSDGQPHAKTDIHSDAIKSDCPVPWLEAISLSGSVSPERLSSDLPLCSVSVYTLLVGSNMEWSELASWRCVLAPIGLVPGFGVVLGEGGSEGTALK
jgi:hypothetical protein